MNTKISVLALEGDNNTYTWNQKDSLWAKVEQLKGKNIFSSFGMGARSVKFTIRKNSSISLHNAFKWQGKHCFLTDILELNKECYEVLTALIEPKICTVERTGKPTLNELNRPVYSDPITISFPACLTEKYLGYTQGVPMATVENRLVLVTPKDIELEPGEIVIIENVPYTVEVPHILDEFKNEYEVMARGDA